MSYSWPFKKIVEMNEMPLLHKYANENFLKYLSFPWPAGKSFENPDTYKNKYNHWPKSISTLQSRRYQQYIFFQTTKSFLLLSYAFYQ